MRHSWISLRTRERVRKAAGDRCGYCRVPQHLIPVPLEVEHIVPVILGGTDDDENLWLSCRVCNTHKGTQVTGIDPDSGAEAPLFDPRRQHWQEHFEWDPSGLCIMGRTACGRVTVVALKLNNPLRITTRRYWVSVGWHPPRED